MLKSSGHWSQSLHRSVKKGLSEFVDLFGNGFLVQLRALMVLHNEYDGFDSLLRGPLVVWFATLFSLVEFS